LRGGKRRACAETGPRATARRPLIGRRMRAEIQAGVAVSVAIVERA